MANISEERIREIIREELDKRSADNLAEFERHLPRLLDRIKTRGMG